MAPENQTEHYILIEPVYVSKAKRVLCFFKPSEIVQNTLFELSLKFTNKGQTHFPGGKIPKLTAGFGKAGIDNYKKNVLVPDLARDESQTIRVSPFLTHSDGSIAIEGKIEANDGKPVKYYQRDKADGSLELLEKPQWIDFLSAVSQQELNQKYTNYLLVLLNLLLILLTIALVVSNFYAKIQSA